MVEITRADLALLRQYFLGITAVIERIRGDILTTAEMRKWFKAFGPTPQDAKEQLEQK